MPKLCGDHSLHLLPLVSSTVDLGVDERNVGLRAAPADDKVSDGVLLGLLAPVHPVKRDLA